MRAASSLCHHAWYLLTELGASEGLVVGAGVICVVVVGVVATVTAGVGCGVTPADSDVGCGVGACSRESWGCVTLCFPARRTSINI